MAHCQSQLQCGGRLQEAISDESGGGRRLLLHVPPGLRLDDPRLGPGAHPRIRPGRPGKTHRGQVGGRRVEGTPRGLLPKDRPLAVLG